MKAVSFDGKTYKVFTLHRCYVAGQIASTEVIAIPSEYPSGTLCIHLLNIDNPYAEPPIEITADIDHFFDERRQSLTRAFLNTPKCAGWLLPFILETHIAHTHVLTETLFDTWYHLWEFNTASFYTDLPPEKDIPSPTSAPPPEDVPPPMPEDFLPTYGQEDLPDLSLFDDLPPDDLP